MKFLIAIADWADEWFGAVALIVLILVLVGGGVMNAPRFVLAFAGVMLLLAVLALAWPKPKKPYKKP